MAQHTVSDERIRRWWHYLPIEAWAIDTSEFNPNWNFDDHFVEVNFYDDEPGSDYAPDGALAVVHDIGEHNWFIALVPKS